jgi:NTE family protein
MKKPKRIGLALGGGAARGLVHVGVLKALEEEGIPIDCIAAVSAGAIAGAVYAAGNLKAFEERAKKVFWGEAFRYLNTRIRGRKKGIFDWDKAALFIDHFLDGKDIEDLRIPFAVVTTDISKSEWEEVLITSGKAIDAIRAAISFPPLLPPFEREGRTLYDGGYVNPIPISVVRDMGVDHVIAVDLMHVVAEENSKQSSGVMRKIKNWFTRNAIYRPLGLSEEEVLLLTDKLTKQNLVTHPPDVLIQPDLRQFLFSDFHRADGMISAGYEATKVQMGEIKDLLTGRP